jgi:hypothetical protein
MPFKRETRTWKQGKSALETGRLQDAVCKARNVSVGLTKIPRPWSSSSKL